MKVAKIAHAAADLPRRGAEQHEIVGGFAARRAARRCIRPGPGPTRSRSSAAAGRASRTLAPAPRAPAASGPYWFRSDTSSPARPDGPIGAAAEPGAPMFSSSADPRRRAADTTRPRARRRQLHAAVCRAARVVSAADGGARNETACRLLKYSSHRIQPTSGCPRQHAKGRRIGNDGEIGRAGHLVEAHAAAARERREGARAGRNRASWWRR